MRPVNLIPPEQRHGERAPLRAGTLSYLVVAGLGLALAAVCALVLTGNAIKDREAELTTLTAQEAAVRAEAERLSGFAEFASLSETRALTVSSLAESRFDWERVLRELALVLPDDVWLIQLSGTATPEVQLDNAAEVAIETGTAGPSLSMVGCAAGHEAVAGFVQALRDIDGVTRVGVAKSERTEISSDTSVDGGTSGATDCRTRDFISRFEIVATFDQAVVPAVDPNAAPAPGATPTAPGAPSAAEQSGEARQATNIVPGVAR